MSRRLRHEGLLMEALLHTLRNLTPLAQGLCVVLLVLYAFSGVRFIGPSQSALVLRLGKLEPRAHGPGLLFAWPKPIDEVVVLETGAEHTLALDAWAPRGPRVEASTGPRQFTAAEIEAQLQATGNAPLPVETTAAGDFLDPVTDGYSVTGDLNILQGQFALRYRIADPVAFFRHGHERVNTFLASLARRAAASALSERGIDRCLTSERDALATTVRNRVARYADVLQLGVAPTAFEIRELTPPRQVAAAFEDVTSARLFARTLVENAEEYRQRQLTTARGQAAAIAQRADAAARQLVASAEGEANAFRDFHAEYQRSPDLLRTRLYADTLNHVMQQVNSTTLLPPGANTPSVFLEPSPTVTR
jgi:modulator of FtsH protease HflK